MPWLKGRKEGRGRALQLRHHGDLTIAHGEMHQRPVGKGQQRLGILALGPGQAVKAILVDGVADALGEIRLQFHRGHRHAIEEEPEVEAVLVGEGVFQLPHDAQPVGGVARHDVGIDREGRFKFRQFERLLESQQLDAMPQYVERAALVDLVAQAGQQGFAGLRAVHRGHLFPGFRLRCLHPGEHIGREERPRPIVGRRIALGIQPAIRAEMLADLGLEADFLVQTHGAGGGI